MRAVTGPAAAAVVLALAGCGGSAAPEPADDGPLAAYVEAALGASEYGRAQWDAEQEALGACMSEAGFEYTPEPFTDGSVVTFGGERTRESVAETGWGIIPTDVTPYEPEPESTDPNDAYYRSLSASAQAEYERAMTGPPEKDPDAYVPEEYGCWGRARASTEQSSPYTIEGFESLQADMQRKWEQIQLQPVYVAALEQWSACMADAGHPGLRTLEDAMNLVETRFEEEFPGSSYRLDDPRLPELATWEREVAVTSFDCEVAASTSDAAAQAQSDWENAFIADHHAELEALVEAVREARG